MSLLRGTTILLRYSDFRYRRQNETTSLERPNQGNRIEMKDRNQEEIHITLKEELESGISKKQIDGFQKGG